MTIRESFGRQGFPKILRLLIIISLILGIFYRFYNLDTKPYSNDETFSATNIFGRNLSPIIDIKIVTGEELQTYQRFNPEESLPQAFIRLVKKPYVFPPLYSILMEIWARLTSSLFHNHPAITTRSLSALISLFSLPAAYWLAWELSQSRVMAEILTSLIAVSPFHLQYSQIVRTYSLTTALILISSAALLRAIRVQNISSWAIYAATVATGLYSNVLFGFVIISHSFYMLLREKIGWTRSTKLYLISSLVGIILFLPWFISFLSTPSLFDYSVAQPVGGKLSLLGWFKVWIPQIRTIFLDLNDPWIESTKLLAPLQKILSIFIFILIPISLYIIASKPRESINLFSLNLIFFGGILLMAKDVVSGGTFSSRLRYMIPYVIGIQLTVAYFFTTQLLSVYRLRRKIVEVSLGLLIIIGILSSTVVAISPNWWAFGVPDYNKIALTLQQKKNSVIVFEDWGDALTMSYLMPLDTSFHLTRRLDYHLLTKKGDIYKNFAQVIVFKPSEATLKSIKVGKNIQLESVFKKGNNSSKTPSNIWQINIK